MTTLNPGDQAAIEAARRAQEERIRQQAREQAAKEFARLAAEQRAAQADAPGPGQPAVPGGAGAEGQITRDTFRTQALGLGVADEEELGSLFDRFDTDGVAGLSEAELSAVFEAHGAARAAQPPQASNGAVTEELAQAFKDDKDTDQDFSAAADHARTPEDVDLIMAAAEAKGHGELEVLNELLERQDPDADPPNGALFEAIARHFDRLGLGPKAEAVRLAGDPRVSRGVRRDAIFALRDATDTAGDLRDATKHVRSGRDLDALLAVQRAVGGESPKALLQRTLKHLDGGAEVPPTGLLLAIARKFDGLGEADMARAVREASRPDLPPEVREKLIHALEDDVDTQSDIDAAIAGAENQASILAVGTVARALGLPGAAEQGAYRAIEVATEAYDGAMKRAQEGYEVLAVAEAKTEGLPDAERLRVLEAVKAKYAAEFAAVDQAAADLAQAVAVNHEAVATMLRGGAAPDGADLAIVERALVVAASTPGGLAAAEAIATSLGASFDQLGEGLRKTLEEQVYPAIVNATMERALADPNIDPADALDQVARSPVFAALELSKLGSKPAKYLGDFKKLIEGLRGGDQGAVDQAFKALTTSEALKSGFAIALAGAGLVGSIAEFGEGEGTSRRVAEVLAVGKDGVKVLGEAAKAIAASTGREWFSKASKNLEKAGKGFSIANGLVKISQGKILDGITDVASVAGPYYKVVDGVTDGLLALGNHQYKQAFFELGAAALGLVAASLNVPGLNLAGIAVTAGLISWEIHKQTDHRNEINGKFAEIAGSVLPDANLVEFLRRSPAGAYQAVRSELGLSDAEIAKLLRKGDAWIENLDDLATPHFRVNVLPHMAPNGDVMGAFERFDENMPGVTPAERNGIRNAAFKALQEMANVEGRYASLEGAFEEAIALWLPYYDARLDPTSPVDPAVVLVKQASNVLADTVFVPRPYPLEGPEATGRNAR